MKLLSIIIILTLHCIAFSCDKSSIIIAWENYPPFIISGDSLNNNPKGISIDLVSAALKKINCSKNIKFVSQPWKRSHLELEKGRVDILLNALKSPDREKYAYYKKYFSRSRNAIFVNSENYDKLFKLSLEELVKINNFVIGYTNGYNYGDLFINIQEKYPNKFEMALHDDLSIIKTSKGRVNALIGDVALISQMIKDLKKDKRIDSKINFKPLPVNLSSKPPFSYFIYSKKSMPEKFISKIDDALSQIYNEGITKKIFLRYLSPYEADLILIKPGYE